MLLAVLETHHEEAIAALNLRRIVRMVRVHHNERFVESTHRLPVGNRQGTFKLPLVRQLLRLVARRILKSVTNRNYVDSAEQSEPTLAYCEKENLGFIPWFPLGGGGSSLTRPGNPLEAEAKRRNATTAQLALAWLLQKSAVMLPIPGTSSIKHLEENMAAAKIDISAGDWKKIEALAARA